MRDVVRKIVDLVYVRKRVAVAESAVGGGGGGGGGGRRRAERALKGEATSRIIVHHPPPPPPVDLEGGICGYQLFSQSLTALATNASSQLRHHAPQTFFHELGILVRVVTHVGALWRVKEVCHC